jgi:hypothetical protein
MVAKIFVLLTVLFFLAQENSSSPSDVEKIVGEVEIRKVGSGGEWRAVSELRDVNVVAGGNYQLTLKIKNTDQDEFRFSRSVSGCDCTSFKIAHNKISSGESIDAVFSFKIPDSSSKSEYSVSARFLTDNGAEAGLISVSFAVAGNLHVQFSSNSRLKSTEISEILMPIIVSSPIEVSNIEVDGEDSFEGIDVLASIILIDGSPMLRVIVQNLMRDGSAVSGRLTVRDTITKKTVEVPMLLIEEAPIQVAPLIINFRKINNTNEDSFQSRCILKFNHLPEEGDEAETEPAVFAYASFNGKPLNVDISRLSRSVFRLKITSTVKEIDAQEDATKIIWEIKRGEKTYNTETFVSIE